MLIVCKNSLRLKKKLTFTTIGMKIGSSEILTPKIGNLKEVLSSFHGIMSFALACLTEKQTKTIMW